MIIMQEKITIATIVRNDIEGFLTTAKSVVEQTYGNIEWVVIDGASNDGTSDFVKRFLNRIEQLVIEADEGVYDAMNKAIELASGGWLIFMNAGDIFYEKETVSKLVSRTLQDDDVVWGSVVGLEDDEMKFHRLPEEYYLGMIFDHQAVMVRTHLYKSFGYNKEYRVSGDFDFFSRLQISGCNFRKLEYLIVTRKPYLDGISASFEDRLSERVRIIKRYFNDESWADIVKAEIESYINIHNSDAVTKNKLLSYIE